MTCFTSYTPYDTQVHGMYVYVYMYVLMYYLSFKHSFTIAYCLYIT